jgi:hypothetical protein
LLRRLREIRDNPELQQRRTAEGPPLVVIALDGENAWEYYPRDGRDFLKHLYDGLAADDSLRCVTVSEHLAAHPPTRPLGWLHTGSWIGGDLRTWSGDRGHNAAWDLLHSARDLAAARRSVNGGAGDLAQTEAVWRHVLAAEGSDWFWWFGNHHHTELDYVWDLNFRLHLQAVYRALGEPVPLELFFPVLGEEPDAERPTPTGAIAPTIDGVIGPVDEWSSAGFLQPDLFATMRPSETTPLQEVRFGWMGSSLCLLVAPAGGTTLEGLEVEVRLTRADQPDGPVVRLDVGQAGGVGITLAESAKLAGPPEAAWKDVLEVRLPLAPDESQTASSTRLVVRIGRQGLTEHVFHSTNLASAE